MHEIIEESRASVLPGGKIRFVVCRPPARPCGGVLYLLHGLFGAPANWLDSTRLTEYLAGSALGVVLVDGRDSWYCDSAAGMFETAFFDEVAPAAERLLAPAGKALPRGVAGLSMGGYGAVKFALRRPGMFRFVASMSGAFEAPFIDPDAPPAGREDLAASIATVFGGLENAVRRDNDVFALAAQADAAVVPKIFLDCGRDDVFLGCNLEFARTLESRGIDHEFEVCDGGHDWDYWNARLAFVIERAEAAIGGRE